MSKRSVEKTKKRLEKQIKKLSQSREKLICKLIDKPMTKTNRYWTMRKIDNYERLIRVMQNCIEYGCQQSRGSNG